MQAKEYSGTEYEIMTPRFMSVRTKPSEFGQCFAKRAQIVSKSQNIKIKKNNKMLKYIK